MMEAKKVMRGLLPLLITLLVVAALLTAAFLFFLHSYEETKNSKPRWFYDHCAFEEMYAYYDERIRDAGEDAAGEDYLHRAEATLRLIEMGKQADFGPAVQDYATAIRLENTPPDALYQRLVNLQQQLPEEHYAALLSQLPPELLQAMYEYGVAQPTPTLPPDSVAP